MTARLRRTFITSLIRASFVARALAAAFAEEITYTDAQAEDAPHVMCGDAGMVVDVTADGLGVHLGIEAFGGEADGHNLLHLNVTPSAAARLAGALTAAASRAAGNEHEHDYDDD